MIPVLKGQAKRAFLMSNPMTREFVCDLTKMNCDIRDGDCRTCNVPLMFAINPTFFKRHSPEGEDEVHRD